VFAAQNDINEGKQPLGVMAVHQRGRQIGVRHERDDWDGRRMVNNRNRHAQ